MEQMMQYAGSLAVLAHNFLQGRKIKYNVLILRRMEKLKYIKSKVPIHLIMLPNSISIICIQMVK